MRIKFLGTRGGIIAHSTLHKRHSITLVSAGRTRILLDCSADWLNHLDEIKPKPQAIFITHGHPDHIGGLANGCPWPVFASTETWKIINDFPIPPAQRFVCEHRKKIKFGSLTIEPFEVEHSLRAPAMGYRISSQEKTIFYVSDLVKIHNEKQALSNIDLYIGDGAIITRTMLVRHKDHHLVGHSPIETQLAWCKKYKVPRAIFTHCGSEITKHQTTNAINPDTKKILDTIKLLGKKYGVRLEIAIDRKTITLSE